MADDDLAEQGRRLTSGGWQWVGAFSEGGAISLGGSFRGVNPWEHRWEDLGVQVELEEPAYHQRERANIYRIEVSGRWVYFGATELTPGMFGFWRPTVF